MCKCFYDASYLIIESYSYEDTHSCFLAVEVLRVFAIFQKCLEFIIVSSIQPDLFSTDRLGGGGRLAFCILF